MNSGFTACANFHFWYLKRYSVPEIKIVEFANSIDPDQAAPYKLPQFDLQCLPSVL